MIFKDILNEVLSLRSDIREFKDELRKLHAETQVLWHEIQEIRSDTKAALDALSDAIADSGSGFRLDDKLMQEGIANLLAFDGTPQKGSGEN